jgi:hypothetical protein
MNLYCEGAFPPALLCAAGLFLAFTAYRQFRTGRRWLVPLWIGLPALGLFATTVSGGISIYMADQRGGLVGQNHPYLGDAIGVGAFLAFFGYCLATLGAIASALGAPEVAAPRTRGPSPARAHESRTDDP